MSDAEVNHSAAKPYFLLPAPSYWGTLDAGDATQLTDGQRSNGHWLDKACVGWSEGGRDVAVLLDLGAPRVFDTVELSTLRGEFADVLPPLSLRVYVSDDGDEFRLVAQDELGAYDVVDKTVTEREPGKFSEHLTLRLAGFAATGRYVLLAMERGNFLFLDEVAVLRRGEAEASIADGEVLRSGEITARYLGVPRVFDPEIEPYVTPHWPLAKKLSGGSIDAMIVTPVTTARDVEELRQRLDLQVRVIATDEGPESPMNGLLQVRLVRELAERRPEVLVLAGTRWDRLTPDVQRAVTDLVGQGMGLVLVDPRLNLTALREMQLPLTASTSPGAIRLRAEAGIIPMRLGGGRVVLIDEKGRTDYASHTLITPPSSPLGSLTQPPPLDSEYAYSRAARAVFWAARDGGGDRGLDRVAFEAPALKAMALSPGDVAIEVRDVFNELVHRDALSVGPDGEAVFSLPILPGRALHALVQKLDGDGSVEDWRCLAIEQVPPVTIDSLTAPNSVKGSAGSFPLVAQVRRASGVDGDRLRVVVVDVFGRVVHDRRHPLPEEATLSIEVDHPDLLTRSVRLSAVLEREGRAVDERQVWVPVREPARTASGFRLDFWTGANAMAFRHHAAGIYDQTRRLGGDGIFGTWPMSELCNLAAQHDLSTIPENILRVYEDPGSTATHRMPTLGTPEYHAQLEEHIARAIATYERYGIELASLGDECSYATSIDSDRSPAALELFQAWLASRFGTVDSLNRAYGLSLASFADAVPPLTREAAESGEYGLWLAHREFTVHQFTSTLADAAAIFREAYPGAPFGVSGAQLPSVTNGHDYAALVESLDAISVYGAMQRELLRSFAAAEHTHTLWSGFDYSTRNERLERYNIWLALMQGFKGVALFHQFEQRSHALYASGYIGPDLRPHRRALWMRDAIAAIRDAGLGQLVTRARADDRSIGVLYSTRSLMLMAVAPIKAEGYLDGGTLYLDAVGGVIEALRDIQRPYVFIDESRLDRLDPAVTRVLVVPSALSLSDEALSRLAEYVQRGGRIVCGVNVGRFDAFGRPRSPEQVREALGFVPTFVDAMIPAERFETRTIPRGEGFVVDLGASLFDYAPTTVGGVGGELISQGGAAARQAELRGWLDETITPLLPPREVTITDERGERVDWAELFPMAGDRGYRFAGVLGAYREPGLITADDRRAMTIDFGRAGVVYELVTGAGHGHAASAPMELSPGEARFFAVLPHAVTELRASGAVAGGRVSVEAQIVLEGGSAPGPHAIRLEVSDPTGRLRPEYGGVVAADGGRAVHAFELALNDPPGQWQIVAQDTISRAAARVTLMVE